MLQYKTYLRIYVCCLAFTALRTSVVQAQEVPVNLFLNVTGATIQIDDQAARALTTAVWTGKLTAGSHRIQAWAPMRELWDTVVTIQGAIPQRFFTKLRFSSIYYQQASLDSIYDKARVSNVLKASTVLLVNAGLIWYVGFQGVSNRNKYVPDIKASALMYQSAVTKADIEKAKDAYDYYKNLHENHRTFNKWKLLIGVPAVATTLFFGYKIIKKQRKPKKVRLDDPNPLATTQWNIRPDIGFTGLSYHGFTLTLHW